MWITQRCFNNHIPHHNTTLFEFVQLSVIMYRWICTMWCTHCTAGKHIFLINIWNYCPFLMKKNLKERPLDKAAVNTVFIMNYFIPHCRYPTYQENTTVPQCRKITSRESKYLVIDKHKDKWADVLVLLFCTYIHMSVEPSHCLDVIRSVEIP